MKGHQWLLTLIGLVALTVTVAGDPVPELINYQGKLEDSGGPVTDTVDLTFTFYDAASGGQTLPGS